MEMAAILDTGPCTWAFIAEVIEQFFKWKCQAILMGGHGDTIVPSSLGILPYRIISGEQN